MNGKRRKCDRPHIKPSDKVRKCLFGKADEQDKAKELRKFEQENFENLEKMRRKYSYDFVKDKQLQYENAPHTVAKVFEVPCEEDLNVIISSASLENHSTETRISTIRPNKRCLVEGDSHSTSSNSTNLVSGPLKIMQNGDRNSLPDFADISAGSNDQSLNNQQ